MSGLPIFDMQEQMDTLPQKDVEGQLEKSRKAYDMGAALLRKEKS